ncbi:MAG: ABC transporter permease [Dehalococcoidia bacterium]
MKYLASFIVAFHGIMAHKLRSFLTILGVAIGIGSIISMMAVGEGSERSVTEDFTKMGSNLLYIVPGAGYMGLITGAEGSARTLTYEDALSLAESTELDILEYVVPDAAARTQLIAANENANVQVQGTTDTFLEARQNKSLAFGEFFGRYDMENKSLVCVLGSNVSKDLFGDSNPVGERLRAWGRSFTVIGALHSDGESFFSTSDNLMFIPITTMFRLQPNRSASGDDLVTGIGVQVVSESKIDDAIEQITAFLKERHELGASESADFTIYNQQELLDSQTNTSDTLKTLLTYVAAFALAIAGIGIMNIMLVSVTERTREIGIRKAVGAKRHHILIQFLLEATTISIIGGIIGIGVGFLLSEFVFTGFEVTQITMMSQSTIDPVIQAEYIFLSFGVAVGIGIVAGTYPAIRASRLNPIDALRYE